MLARISRSLQINGSKTLFLEFHLHYSTTAATVTAAAKPQKGFAVLEEYLMNSLGFSKQESISTLSKVIRLNPIKKDPDLVVNFLENLGLNRKTHIKSIVSSIPSLLFSHVEKTLKPKIDFFRELGLSGPELVRFVMGFKFILKTGLDSHIRPRINYFRQLLGSDDKLVTSFKEMSFASCSSCNSNCGRKHFFVEGN